MPLPAGATTVHVAFEGVIDSVSGSPPAGVTVGSSFYGEISYGPGDPVFETSSSSFHEYPVGEAELWLLLGGTRYEPDTTADPVALYTAVHHLWFVNRFNWNLEVPPLDPLGVFLDAFAAGWGARGEPAAGDHRLSLEAGRASPTGAPGLFDSTTLPTSEELAALLVSEAASIELVEDLGAYRVWGTVTSAHVVPEPGSAALP